MRTFVRLASIFLALSFFHSVASAQKTYSYAEVMAGVGFPTQLVVNEDGNARSVEPGHLGTTIVINGLFPLSRLYTFSPSFGFLSTNSDVGFSEGFEMRDTYKARFQQSELAVDFLIKSREGSRFCLGPGISGAWWVAAEDIEHRPTDYYYDDERRVTRGQSFMARGVAHLMLRNPAVSGASIKLIGAYPLAEALKIDNTSASAYISLQVGFSMLLN